jgi:hypothetical protein
MGGVLPSLKRNNGRSEPLSIDQDSLKYDSWRVKNRVRFACATQGEIFRKVLQRLIAKPGSERSWIESPLSLDPGLVSLFDYVPDFLSRLKFGASDFVERRQRCS